MASRVLVIGLDAADAGLIDRWREELPVLEHLQSNSATGVLHNPAGLLPGAVWPMLNTGESPGRSGLFYHPAQVRTGEAEARSVGDEDLDGSRDFWSVAASHGLRTVAVDPIQAPLMTGLQSAAQLIEWGSHDALGMPRSHPAPLLDEVAELFGPYPVDRCDYHGRSRGGYERLLDGLVAGADVKARVIRYVLDQRDWDLASVVFTEAHCAGHQFWHLQDPAHPWHSKEEPARLRSSLQEVYRAVDRALGLVLEGAGQDTTVVVVASHGIEGFRRAAALLPDILDRLGYGPGKQGRLRVGAAFPAPAKRLIRRFVGQRALNRWQLGASSRVLRFDGGRTKALAVANGSVGAIRLNLIGREPYGSVSPGQEASVVLDDVATAVEELRDADTGQPITQRVVRTEDEMGSHHPDLPDLLIEFRRDLGTLEHCVSATLGRLGPPVPTVRSGDHHLAGRWWVAGPGVRFRELPETGILDFAPTVLGLAGVRSPDWMGGASLVRLLRGDEGRPA